MGIRIRVAGTPRWDEAIRCLDRCLGYASRAESITVHAPLPLP